MPKNESEWRLVAREYEAKWNFPNCVGAMDGKHKAVQAPEWSGTITTILTITTINNFSALFYLL